MNFDAHSYLEVSQYGQYYPLDIKLDVLKLGEQLKSFSGQWVQYNSGKPHIKRMGLSLFSLEGEIDGRRDLTSLFEQNKINGTEFDEMSFRVKTPIWDRLTVLSEPLKGLEPFLGRSHLIRFGEGGFFPRHRDTGRAFRLISFLYGTPESLVFGLEDQNLSFIPGRLYFVDTRLAHHVFCMDEYAMILVLNVEISEGAIQFVKRHLKAK